MSILNWLLFSQYLRKNFLYRNKFELCFRKNFVLFRHKLKVNLIFYCITALITVHIKFAFKEHATGKYIFCFQGHEIGLVQ